MTFHDLGLDARLADAAQSLEIPAVFFSKMTERALTKKENVCARIALQKGLEAICLIPALQWLSEAQAGQTRKVFVAVPDRETALRAADAAAPLGAALGAECCLLQDGAADLGLAERPCNGDAKLCFQGDASAAILIGSPQSFVAAAEAGLVRPKDYGFLVAPAAEGLAELSAESMRKFIAALLPSWERRTVLACSKMSVKVKTLARDLSDNHAEIQIESEEALAEHVASETWRVAVDVKLRFMLDLVERERAERICVFCNHKDSAEQLSKRIAANGIASDYLLGALAPDRKQAVFQKTMSGRCRVLVLTDKGAEDLPRSSFALVVNYEIPLEPELYIRRLGMLQSSAPGAKIVNLACDRYIAGLAAIERQINAALELKEASPDRFSAEDASEGTRYERPGDFASRSRSERPSGRGEARRGTRDESPRAVRRDGRSRKDRHAAGDNVPDIRRSIAEATGGSLDVESMKLVASRAPEVRTHDKKSGDARRTESRREAGPKQRRGETEKNKRRDAGDRTAAGGTGRGRRETSGKARTQGAFANPYELPMEERMRMYRKKYGTRSEVSAKTGKNSSRAARAAEPEKSAPTQPAKNPAGPRGGFWGKLFGRKPRD